MPTAYIDPLETAADHYRLLMENDSVRVIEMRLPAGEKDNVHSHPAETVLFLQGGHVRLHLPDSGSVELEFPDGHVMWHEWTHQVETIGRSDILAIIVEAKSAP